MGDDPKRRAAIEALTTAIHDSDDRTRDECRIACARVLDAFLSEAEGAKKTSGHYGGNGRPHTYWHGTPCDCSWGADHGNGTGDAPDFAAPATGKRTPLDSSSAKGDEELGKLGRDAYMIAAGQVACADWSDCTPARREEWIAAASAVRAAVEEGTQSHLGRVYEQYAANIDAANARADKAESERDAALARVEEIRIAHGSALNRVAEMERELAVLRRAAVLAADEYREKAEYAADECRAGIVNWMRTSYPMNKHALEWADAIEKREDMEADPAPAAEAERCCEPTGENTRCDLRRGHAGLHRPAEDPLHTAASTCVCSALDVSARSLHGAYHLARCPMYVNDSPSQAAEDAKEKA